ncbi:AAA family ATPase [Thorsellia anophelis]|uniref:Exonuclease SbcC n=1 Tax=Thorsellia anophelis DSM 18579 TaxID=1123402 RepID=A0A1I0CU58_9GAMM|nr:AAA family ATPase [Thorsellia anophelis]SET22823.1 exonuclease SbcC [Thorsellia anophelis DSM 18579]
MKIRQLRLKNLNSLFGEWEIDFTDTQYLANGIFAITGATGAGKSTILDAICLALYGATPRLGRITKSSNEIMSRQTGECYAEVVFESQAGVFLCHFEQRRAKKLASGNLQEPEHQIAYLDGTLIENKKSLVLDVIVEKTGMDFERFTRSMLLAQGAFDSFLKASLDDKSKILEQITGMEIYSDISKLVFEQHKVAKNDYEALKQSTSHLQILSEDILSELTDRKKILISKDSELNNAIYQIQQHLNWHNDIAQSLTLINSFKQIKKQLLDDNERFNQKRIQLVAANRAEQLERYWSPIEALSSTLKEEESLHLKLQAAIPSLNTQLSNDLTLFENASLKLKELNISYESMMPAINQTKILDKEILFQSQSLNELESEHVILKNKLNNLLEEIKEQEVQKQKTELDLSHAHEYMSQYGKVDARLMTSLSGLIQRIHQLDKAHAEMEKLVLALIQSQSRRVSHDKKIAVQLELHAGLNKKIKVFETKLLDQQNESKALLKDRSLNEYRLEKEYYIKERAYIDRIASLETQRGLLEDNTPCPLCGSLEHPYSIEKIPEAREIDGKIIAITELITQIEALDQAKKITEAELALLKQSVSIEEGKIHTLNIELKHEIDNMSTLRLKEEELKLLTEQEIHLLNLELIEYSLKYEPYKSQHLIAQLTQKQERYSKHSETLSKGAAILQDIETKILKLNTVQDSTQVHITGLTQKIVQSQSQLQHSKNERSALLGSNDPIQLEDSFNLKLKNAQATADSLTDRLNQAKINLASKQQELSLLEQRINKSKEQLATDKSSFIAQCNTLQFATIEDFLNARLTSSELERLSTQAKELDDELLRITSQIDSATTQHQLLLSKYIDIESKEVLEQLLAQKEGELNQLKIDLNSITFQLEKNEQTKLALSELTTKIIQSRQIALKHEKLNNLIGSSDGKKFRSFAQGLTFEIMVRHANKQLQKMSDRYLLQRDSYNPLSLNIIDNYQAGEIRSIKNLSGGESFIVSLALALGLSKMSSQTIRVDSLFLDEGFGTLDEEALDTALDALSTLQKENKLIGIISHVPALKNRISTQITIDAQNGGRSTLAGPSCVRLS